MPLSLVRLQCAIIVSRCSVPLTLVRLQCAISQVVSSSVVELFAVIRAHLGWVSSGFLVIRECREAAYHPSWDGILSHH